MLTWWSKRYAIGDHTKRACFSQSEQRLLLQRKEFSCTRRGRSEGATPTAGFAILARYYQLVVHASDAIHLLRPRSEQFFFSFVFDCAAQCYLAFLTDDGNVLGLSR